MAMPLLWTSATRDSRSERSKNFLPTDRVARYASVLVAIYGEDM
jgi:hypothetical protein